MTDASDVIDVRLELQRVAASASYNEGFWQKKFEPYRQDMLLAKLKRRDELQALMSEAQRLPRNTIREKREARKADNKARRALGLLRALEQRLVPDQIEVDFNIKTSWIAEARDLAIMLHRFNQKIGTP